MIWLPDRLRAVSGTTINEAAIKTWMQLGESDQLDFKREWWSHNDAGKREFCRDVAAFANAAGGVLVVGIAEEGTPEVVGADPGGKPEEWSRAVIARAVSPIPRFSVERIPTEAGDCWMISIPPSSDAPHAVWIDRQKLVYPVRNGTTKRYMDEREVGIAYARRSKRSTEAKQDLAELTNLGSGQFSGMLRSAHLEATSKAAYRLLTVAMVPSLDGAIELRRGIAIDTDSWIETTSRTGPNPVSRQIGRARVGFRSIVVEDDPRNGLPLTRIELHADGSGVATLAAPLQWIVGTFESDPSQWVTWDSDLFADCFTAVAIFAHHAERAGAGGDLRFAATVWSEFLGTPDDQGRRFTVRPTSSGPPLGPRSERRPETDRTPVAFRSRSLSALFGQPVEHLDLSRDLAGDLGSAFGLEECRQVTTELQLDLMAFQDHDHARVRQWAEFNGVPIKGDS